MNLESKEKADILKMAAIQFSSIFKWPEMF